MKQNIDSIVVRKACESDGPDITNLFCEDESNPYGWDVSKWNHYYLDYPEGLAIALVAEVNSKIVGHYGMVPVKIGRLPAMLGLHAYVSTYYRGLTVISALMKEVDNICRAEGIALICGFANSSFSLIKKTFFKWDIPIWLGFKSDLAIKDIKRDNQPFYFNYSDNWYEWRFGEIKSEYLSRYENADGIAKKQLLKMRKNKFENGKLHLEGVEAWTPTLVFAKEQNDLFCQPLAVKIFDRRLIDEGVLVTENWFVEMGDSDTFNYTPWSESL
jgi:hypothetical protein